MAARGGDHIFADRARARGPHVRWNQQIHAQTSVSADREAAHTLGVAVASADGNGDIAERAAAGSRKHERGIWSDVGDVLGDDVSIRGALGVRVVVGVAGCEGTERLRRRLEPTDQVWDADSGAVVRAKATANVDSVGSDGLQGGEGDKEETELEHDLQIHGCELSAILFYVLRHAPPVATAYDCGNEACGASVSGKRGTQESKLGQGLGQ